MFKLKSIIFLIFLFIHFRGIGGCSECSKPYVAPHNMKYPLGDEQQINTDVAENDTNTLICEYRSKLMPAQGRCPFPPDDPADMHLTNPYIQCPIFPELTTPGIIPIGEPLPPSDVQCKNCDIKLTQDDTAVLLKCTGCYDLPRNERTANYTEKEILYKVFFIQISNYSSVKVTGKENF